MSALSTIRKCVCISWRQAKIRAREEMRFFSGETVVPKKNR